MKCVFGWCCCFHISHLPPTCHSVFSFLSSRFYIYIKLNTFLSIRNEHFHFLNYACWWHSISLCSLSRFMERIHERLTVWLSTSHSTSLACWKCQWIFDEGSETSALAVDKLSLLIHPEKLFSFSPCLDRAARRHLNWRISFSVKFTEFVTRAGWRRRKQGEIFYSQETEKSFSNSTSLSRL